VIRIFTTSYEDPRPQRRSEYLACLDANLRNDAIGEVCVIAEGLESSLPKSPRLRVRYAESRPAYDDFRSWINEIVKDDDISVIANSDIHFDESLRIAARMLRQDECYALARWHHGRLSDRNDSQDAWVFRGKIRPVRGDYPLGVPRCDNRFLRELRDAGYEVQNPSFAIRANHLHAGDPRHYDVATSGAWVAPPYGYLWPHNLFSLPRTLWHNATHPEERIRWSVDRRAAVLLLGRRVSRRLRRMLASSGSSA